MEISYSNVGPSGAISADFANVLQNLVEIILLCRPPRALEFSRRYLADEKAFDRDHLHACHSLPFLLGKPGAFRDAVAAIFCSLLAGEGATAPASSSSKGKRITKPKSLGKPLSSVFQLMQSDFFEPPAALSNCVRALAGPLSNPEQQQSTLEHKESGKLHDDPNESLLGNAPWGFDVFLAALQLVVSSNALSIWLLRQIKQDGGGTHSPNESITYEKKSLRELIAHKRSSETSVRNRFWAIEMEDSWRFVALQVIERFPAPSLEIDRVRDAIIVEYFTLHSKEISKASIC